jgi:hypothetical protein
MFYWTASNNNSFLNGRREAKTMLGAVRDARSYLRNELYGEGNISYYDSEDAETPIRTDEKTIFTNHRWETRTEF